MQSLPESHLPPHSIEAEQSVIGGLILAPDTFDDVASRLVSGDFYNHDHQVFFNAISNLVENNKPIDVITVSEELNKNESFDDLNALSYLVEIAKNTPSSANITAYADIVRERAILRALIAASNKITNNAYNSDIDSNAQLEAAEQSILEIGEGAQKNGETLDTLTVAKAFIERLHEQSAKGDSLIGESTGYSGLDDITKGLRPSQLVVVAGRPSMGKTTFALNIAQHLALNSDKKVLIFSIEQPAIELMSRFVSSISNIPGGRLDSAQLQPHEWEKLADAMKKIHDSGNFIFEESQCVNPAQCRSIARRVKREHKNLGLIVIDYVQLMSMAGKSDNRTQEIAAISRGIKLMAREMNVPVIVVSQLNRELERRQNKRPMLSDLRDSGAIEQDADLVIFLHREKYYDKENENEDDNSAEIIVSKNRHGALGTINAQFNGECFKFEQDNQNDY